MIALRHTAQGPQRRDDANPARIFSPSPVTIVVTIYNDAEGGRLLLDALRRQTLAPSRIIVVDGGSTDGTLDILDKAASECSMITVLREPGANISEGRNRGIAAANDGIIALTDSGCRPAEDWLAAITQPFRDDPGVDWVGGNYKLDSRTEFEQVVGLATMPGQLDPIDPETFNPSARSMALQKHTWIRAGGFPERLYTAEDTLFDMTLRQMGVKMHFAPGAIVYWRPRSTWRAVAKQFYLYGRGNGNAHIGASASLYNIRNITLLLLCATAMTLASWAAIAVAACLIYFFVTPNHKRCTRVAARVSGRMIYVRTLCVCWTVTLFDALGYIAGTLQRWVDPRRFCPATEAGHAKQSVRSVVP